MSGLLKLRSSNGDVMETSVKCARMSHTVSNQKRGKKITNHHDWVFEFHQIKDLIESLGLDTSANQEVVPLPNVSTNSLKKVIEYIEHYQDTPQPSSEEIKDKLAETICSWDEDFLRMPLEELYDLVSWLN